MDATVALATVDWLAVLVAAVSTFVLGGLWYGPLFGEAWMRASGVTEEEAREGNKPMIFGVSFVLQLVAAAVLAMFIGPEGGLSFGLLAGASVGIAWVSTTLGVHYLFEGKSFAHWAVNAGYSTVAFAVMGAILGAW